MILAVENKKLEFCSEYLTTRHGYTVLRKSGGPEVASWVRGDAKRESCTQQRTWEGGDEFSVGIRDGKN